MSVLCCFPISMFFPISMLLSVNNVCAVLFSDFDVVLCSFTVRGEDYYNPINIVCVFCSFVARWGGLLSKQLPFIRCCDQRSKAPGT